jgi:predicted TPR repeat methyltransferase
MRAAPLRLVGPAAAALLLAVGGLSLTRQGLVQHYRDRAQGELARRPAAALADANRALRIDADDIDSYYVKAAAFARFDQPAPARAALLAAARRAPQGWVTWALLGDLSVRAGDLRAARRAYGRALRLNPRDPALRSLVSRPQGS